MKKFKNILLAGTIVTAMFTTSLTVFAETQYKSPAEIVADLTGKTVEEVLTENYNTGKSFAAMADDAGKLDEFKEQDLENRKNVIRQRQEDGFITKEEADSIIDLIENNQSNGYGYYYGGGGCCGYGGYGGYGGHHRGYRYY